MPEDPDDWFESGNPLEEPVPPHDETWFLLAVTASGLAGVFVGVGITLLTWWLT